MEELNDTEIDILTTIWNSEDGLIQKDVITNTQYHKQTVSKWLLSLENKDYLKIKRRVGRSKIYKVDRNGK